MIRWYKHEWMTLIFPGKRHHPIMRLARLRRPYHGLHQALPSNIAVTRGHSCHVEYIGPTFTDMLLLLCLIYCNWVQLIQFGFQGRWKMTMAELDNSQTNCLSLIYFNTHHRNNDKIALCGQRWILHLALPCKGGNSYWSSSCFCYKNQVITAHMADNLQSVVDMTHSRLKEYNHFQLPGYPCPKNLYEEKDSKWKLV